MNEEINKEWVGKNKIGIRGRGHVETQKKEIADPKIA